MLHGSQTCAVLKTQLPKSPPLRVRSLISEYTVSNAHVRQWAWFLCQRSSGVNNVYAGKVCLVLHDYMKCSNMCVRFTANFSLCKAVTAGSR